jgi:alpha-L-arabinofuranosidase
MHFPRVFRRTASLASLALVGTSWPFVTAAVAKTTVSIDARAAGRPISPDLFGIFFEDLNYAADGGLYAELLQNRSFEYDTTEHESWTAMTAWSLEQRGGGNGYVRISTAAPLHPNNPHYAALVVKQPGEGVGLANSGYDGIPLQAGAAYEFSCFGHQLFMGEQWREHEANEEPMPLTVRLETAEGDVLASADFQLAGRSWQQKSVTLTPSRTVPNARLVVLAKAQGAVALDQVSLFPTRTFHDRRNGLRADLAQTIADLHPKFMRFPGGCLAHGDGLGNMYRWKDTIGPVEQRRGQRNLWGYHQSVGLGYFEYFQFCEDIGARPLPVLPAGVCCQNSDNSPSLGQAGLPLEQMRDYIQEVLDLIEWANGPATSPWGAKRADAGHPEPFGLKYLGIGNEDKITPVFEERFKMIHDAIKAAHPEIEVIGTVGPFPDGEDFERGWTFAKDRRVPAVDEHYYKPPQWFWDNLSRYDRYDRAGPRVYVGEYAAHDTKRRNTLRSALAEAAGMTGLERNGDVVQLASYAPLLARRGHTQWTPDMIYFTGTSVVRTTNYYVQQLFARNSGDHALATTIAPNAAQLAVSSVRDSKSGDVIVKLVNGSGSAQDLSLRLEGETAAPLHVARTVLASDNADAVNEDGQPPAVEPVTTELTVGSAFDCVVPANSLTVLRLRR